MPILSRVGGWLAYFFANYVVYTIARFWGASDWRVAQNARATGTLDIMLANRLFIASLLPYTLLFTIAAGGVLYATAPMLTANAALLLLLAAFGGAVAIIWSLITLVMLLALWLIPATRRAAVARMDDILRQRKANDLEA
ncbi:MAG: hypothetical protein GC134_05280 [Proteobacteria bacterium]|nr:hypothetical protein [Pseudomonadota bacterium]